MRGKLLPAVAALLVSLGSGLRIQPSGENLYTRHNVQAARDYHLVGGNVTEKYLSVPVNHFTTNNTNV